MASCPLCPVVVASASPAALDMRKSERSFRFIRNDVPLVKRRSSRETCARRSRNNTDDDVEPRGGIASAACAPTRGATSRRLARGGHDGLCDLWGRRSRRGRSRTRPGRRSSAPCTATFPSARTSLSRSSATKSTPAQMRRRSSRPSMNLVTRSIAGSSATLISSRPNAACPRRSTRAIRHSSRCLSISKKSFDRRSEASWRPRRRRAMFEPTSIRQSCCWLSHACARRMIRAALPNNRGAWSRCWWTGFATGPLPLCPARLRSRVRAQSAGTGLDPLLTFENEPLNERNTPAAAVFETPGNHSDTLRRQSPEPDGDEVPQDREVSLSFGFVPIQLRPLAVARTSIHARQGWS